MLACLEYIAHHYGIHPHMGTVWFSLGSGSSYEYEAECYGHQYRILSNGQKAEIQVDGKAVGTWKCGIRIIAQETGQVVRMENIESE